MYGIIVNTEVIINTTVRHSQIPFVECDLLVSSRSPVQDSRLGAETALYDIWQKCNQSACVNAFSRPYFKLNYGYL